MGIVVRVIGVSWIFRPWRGVSERQIELDVVAPGESLLGVLRHGLSNNRLDLVGPTPRIARHDLGRYTLDVGWVEVIWQGPSRTVASGPATQRTVGDTSVTSGQLFEYRCFLT